MTTASAGELLYEGKAKKLYATEDGDRLLVRYKDEATAYNGEKHAMIPGKSRLNHEISSLLFSVLEAKGVSTHFIERLSDKEQLVRKVTIIPLEVVVRNVTAGSFAKRFGQEEGIVLPFSVVDFHVKDDALGDPLATDDQLLVLQYAGKGELETLKQRALEVNDILKEYFADKGITLIDFKLEFGYTEAGELIVADEISPDTCRLWDQKTNEKLDKDVFRRDLGSLPETYEKLYKRLTEGK
ncbi:phosphoribosylaminoimidazolesuccinocarboxamide synthase [Bacillus fonticola]|uniref:phosphoribosylaminoimidazolesuccinocarboxamide synthase n=1 Tax=Bacillus fonticola TaxID=2728853 RepID=UPI0014763307|nr:phosphoribosylaminoimidazolesuccinocarboxamide synthase [Bacillus fonticola]